MPYIANALLDANDASLGNLDGIMLYDPTLAHNDVERELFAYQTYETWSKLFTFNDGSSGTSGAGRITNKFVFRSLVGTPGNPDAGSFSRPNPLPIDSSVVGDVNKGTISPNGIY